MSVVINTNYAATVAANNLSASNLMLQKSLNRLSSGSKIVAPSDDAGGLAVSMKLSSAIRRQGAVSTNIGNAVSYLQTQDGALKVAGEILSRISELKTLATDPTKNGSDIANYNAEFTQLQAELTSIGAEKFNGVSLFGTNGLTVSTTESGGGPVTAQSVNLLGAGGVGAPAFAPLTDNFAGMSNWRDSSFWGSSSMSGNVLTLTGANPLSGFGEIDTLRTFTGPFQLTADIRFNSAGGNANITLSNNQLMNLHQGTEISDNNWHALKITVDAAGNANTYLDGSSSPVQTRTGVDIVTPRIISLYQWTTGTTQFRNFSMTSTPVAGSAGNVADVIAAADLGSLNASSATGATQDLATYRAQNGANQSRLGFAAEVNTVNQTNLQAANSRITDVDVAQESTSLARYNILVQGGTSMLTQANQSSQIALKLLS